MLRRILILILVNSVIWLVSIIVLLGLIIFVPRSWAHSTLVAWLVVSLIVAVGGWVVLIRSRRKSRRSAWLRRARELSR